MLDAALRSGVAAHPCVFEVFARRLPPGRRYGVVAGTGRLLDHLDRFRFDGEDIAWLAERVTLHPETVEYLRRYRFGGSISGFAEGEVYFANEPVLTVEATFGEAVLLETLVLSTLNHDAAVAAAASRMVHAARGRALVEMGSRRTHEWAAVAAARAACIAGFASTSNLEAGRRYRLPTAGTSAHAFTLAHVTERQAFEAQVDALGVTTTLLVDTYDMAEGVRLAVEVCRARGATGPGAVRLDSGDLARETRRIRAQLDGLGAGDTAIVVTGDLDEYAIDALEQAPGGRVPVDAYGVGTRLVTGSGAPTAEMIFKLVAMAPAPEAPLAPVAKRSEAKATVGGRKWVWRLIDADGVARADVVRPHPSAPTDAAAVRTGTTLRPLQVPLVASGRGLDHGGVAAAQDRLSASLRELPPGALDVSPGPAAVEVDVG